MLAGLRRALKNPLVLGLLALLGIAFAFTGFDLAGPVGGAGGTEVARVDGDGIPATEVAADAERRVTQARAQDPRADIAQLVEQGGIEAIVDQLIAQRAARAFGDAVGLTVSKAQVDGEIASLPAFRGLNGQFDPAIFREKIGQANLSERQVREEFAGLLLQRQLIPPLVAGERAPIGLAAPYAAMLAEAREGTVGVVAADPAAITTPPTDAQLQAFLRENRVRYLVPERRVIRYALLGPEQVRAAAPTEAEVARFYAANAARFGGSETRVLSQIIRTTEAEARAFAQQLAGGTSFVDAARAAGFSAADISLGPQTREAFTRLSAANVAAAAFAAAEGATTAPVRSPLGYHIVRVDQVQRTGGRSLDQARSEIVAELTRTKGEEAIAAQVDAIEDELADGAALTEVAAKRGLQVVTTPPITAGGQAPGQPGFAAPPELAPLLPAAFAADPEDEPTLETVPGGRGYALLAVGDVVEAAPPPFAQVRAQLAGDWRQREAFRRARATADRIAAAVSRGQSMAEAFRAAGVQLAPRDIRARRLDVAQGNTPPPPPLTLLFQLPQGRARALPAPQEAGVFVVHHRRTVPARAEDTPGLAQATRTQFGQGAANEYAEQFVRAMQREVGVTRNAAAIARIKRELDGSAARN